MNLTKFSSSGFQGELMETHKLALESHYKVDPLLELNSLKDPMDGS